ncbi:MAG TPA: PilZ domain-containing protein [Polyangia bacterium]|nr:PilZ domain-containing protein [Polyangia bacterium]
MTQARRVSPRIPYDEAICLARIDGRGRLYGRGLDLSATGLSLVCADAAPIGTEIKCDLLLPHGPRPVSGRIVRVTAAPGGFELAVSFGELSPSVTAAIEQLLGERTRQVLPAKLRIDGVDKPLRCEAHLDDRGEQVVRLTATLPFLRLDGGVDVVLGEQGSVAAAGTIRKIAVDPATVDGVPRLALDVALDEEPRTRTKRYGSPAPAAVVTAPLVRLPPTQLPPPCGHPLPSVMVAPGLQRDVQAVEARPPRRRVHGTAEILRRPDLAAWGLRPAVIMAAASGSGGAGLPTEQLETLEAPLWGARAWWPILLPISVLAAAAVVHFLHVRLWS